MEMILDKDT